MAPLDPNLVPLALRLVKHPSFHWVSRMLGQDATPGDTRPVDLYWHVLDVLTVPGTTSTPTTSLVLVPDTLRRPAGTDKPCTGLTPRLYRSGNLIPVLDDSGTFGGLWSLLPPGRWTLEIYGDRSCVYNSDDVIRSPGIGSCPGEAVANVLLSFPQGEREQDMKTGPEVPKDRPKPLSGPSETRRCPQCGHMTPIRGGLFTAHGPPASGNTVCPQSGLLSYPQQRTS